MSRPHASAPLEPYVCDHIYHEHEKAERVLDISVQCLRVEYRNDVVIDEPAFVSRLASARPERVFQRSKRAYPASEFDEHPPSRDWNVRVNELRPSGQEKSPQYHEENEADVQNDDYVGEETVDHE